MKIFQIHNNIVHYDMTHLYSNVEVARSRYPATTQIVEAPDYVFEGWGFNPNEVGDARFIRPTPPEGWEYDDNTGTFYSPTFDLEAKVANLKESLNKTDYKVIKCYEYSLVGKPLPYDINQLHTERQQYRDEIAVVEAAIAKVRQEVSE